MSLQASLQTTLGRLTAKTLKREGPFVVSVSGTVGKTTTRQAVAAVLGAYNPEKHIRIPIKNYNNELGVPLTVFGMKAPGRSIGAWLSLLWRAWLASVGLKPTGIKTFVLEMGVDMPDDFDRLLAIAQPDIAVMTAITPADPQSPPSHTANFPSLDALAEEESKPALSLQRGQTAILNADDSRLFALRQRIQAHPVLYGTMEAADVRLVSARVRLEEGEYGRTPVGLEVQIESYNRPVQLFIPGVFGTSAAYAMTAAMAVAATLDIDEAVAVQRIQEHFHPMPGRTRIIPGIKHTTLFDDSYNASPVAVQSALRDLGALDLKSTQRRVACLGEMRELGPKTEEMHREVGKEAARQNIDLLIACGRLAHAIADGARAAGMEPERIRVMEDAPEAGLFLQSWIRPGDVILAKASEGPSDLSVPGVRLERIIKELMADPMRAEVLLCRQEPAWLAKE